MGQHGSTTVNPVLPAVGQFDHCIKTDQIECIMPLWGWHNNCCGCYWNHCWAISMHGPSMVCGWILCASLRSCWSPAFAICQMSSTVSSASSPQHFWDPWIFCRLTNSREFTAWSAARYQLSWAWKPICSPDIRSVSTLEVLGNRALQINIYLLIYYLLCNREAI